MAGLLNPIFWAIAFTIFGIERLWCAWSWFVKRCRAVDQLILREK